MTCLYDQTFIVITKMPGTESHRITRTQETRHAYTTTDIIAGTATVVREKQTQAAL